MQHYSDRLDEALGPDIRVVAPPGHVMVRLGKLDAMQRVLVLATLALCRGSKTAAARRLGVSRRAIYGWLHRWS